MQNGRLDELQAGIKIASRNVNNLSYVDDTTLKAESKKELKNLLMRVKEESEKTQLKTKLSPITSWQIEEGKVKAVTNFLLGSEVIADGD